MRALGRKSPDVSFAWISNVLSGKSSPNPNFCVGVARGLNLPAELVLQKAGFMRAQPEDESNMTLKEVWEILKQLDRHQLREVRRFALFLSTTDATPAPETAENR